MATKKIEEVAKTKEELKQMCTDHLIDMVVRRELREELKMRFKRLQGHNTYQSVRLDKACEIIGYAALNDAMDEIHG